MMTAADVSAVTKPWQYQTFIDQLVFTTYNDVMIDNVSALLANSRTCHISHRLLSLL